MRCLKWLQRLTLPFCQLLLGVSNCLPEAAVKADVSLPHNLSLLKPSHLNHAPQHAHINGHHFHSPPALPAPRENLSDDEDEDQSEQGEEDEEEAEEAPRKWQGIEAIFEAYQEYVDGESLLSRL